MKIMNYELGIVKFSKLILQSTIFLIAVIGVLSAQSPDRTKPPQLGPTPTLKLNAVQKFSLSNELQVIVYEKHEVPIVQMNLTVKAGSVNENPNQLGLANLTADMMDEGAGGKNALELSDAIDFLGTTISTFGGMHTSGISMKSTVSKFDESLKLFCDVLLAPSFEQKELDRLKKQYMTSLFQAYDQPRAIAGVATNEFIFGKNHPYGRRSGGTETTISALTVEDLKKFYSTYYLPNNAFVVVVGDVNANEVVKKLEIALASWKKGNVPPVNFERPKQVSGRTVYLIDKPGAAQSVIRVGKVGVERTTEDYFPLIVMNTILGGSFTSRLNSNLREKNGYSYGAGSGFQFRPLPGAFVASSDVQTDVTDKALKEFMNELEAIAKPVSDDELNRAKNYIALGYPDNFSNVASIAGQLSDLIYYNLPENYFNDYISKVMAVKKEDVRRVAKKYLDMDDFAIIIVGDKAKIEDGLKKTKIGKVQTKSIVEVLGPMPKL